MIDLDEPLPTHNVHCFTFIAFTVPGWLLNAIIIINTAWKLCWLIKSYEVFLNKDDEHDSLFFPSLLLWLRKKTTGVKKSTKKYKSCILAFVFSSI